MRNGLAMVLGAALAAIAVSVHAGAKGGGGAKTASTSGLRLVANDPTQTRSNYQLEPHRQGQRWYLYVGHIRGSARNLLTGREEGNCTSVFDTTDPARSTYMAHIAPFSEPWSNVTAEERTGAQHVQLCDGGSLPKRQAGRTYMLRNKGAIGREMVDVTNPL